MAGIVLILAKSNKEQLAMLDRTQVLRGEYDEVYSIKLAFACTSEERSSKPFWM